MYSDVTYNFNSSSKALSSLASGEIICVAEGCDERNGVYPYEIHVYVRRGRYRHEGNWVAVREYVGGLNRLSDSQFKHCDTMGEAVAEALRWI